MNRLDSGVTLQQYNTFIRHSTFLLDKAITSFAASTGHSFEDGYFFGPITPFLTLDSSQIFRTFIDFQRIHSDQSLFTQEAILIWATLPNNSPLESLDEVVSSHFYVEYCIH